MVEVGKVESGLEVRNDLNSNTYEDELGQCRGGMLAMPIPEWNAATGPSNCRTADYGTATTPTITSSNGGV